MTKTSPTRIAVIGAGVMGQNHLRVLGTMRQVEIVGIVDPKNELARASAEKAGCQVFSSIEDIVGHVQAAIIAAPSSNHYEIGKFLLEEGIDCLIEKPLATSEDQCISLIEAATRSKAILMVGHVERFNPAVQQLVKYLAQDAKPVAIEAKRMGTAGKRIIDVDVVADLMIHDLDVIASIVSSKISSIQASSPVRSGIKKGDYVNALLTFENGTTASITASRLTQQRTRELITTCESVSLHLNYITQELYLHRPSSCTEGGCILDSMIEKFANRYTEPLALELHHFVDCVKHRKTPLIDGQKALAALRLVWSIQQQIH